MGTIIHISDYKTRKAQLAIQEITKEVDEQIDLALTLGVCDSCTETSINFTMINNEYLCDKCLEAL